jgi:Ca2+-binding RTX toxin-like protein
MVAALVALAPAASGDIRSDERDITLSQDGSINGSNINGVSEPGDLFGRALATGDFNADDYMDLVVGVRGENSGAGAIQVLYGGANGLRADNDVLYTQNSPGVGCCTEEAGDNFGYSLAVGHFNDDEFADLAIGVPFENQGAVSNSGLVNVFYGTAGGLSTANDTHFAQGDNGFPGTIEAGDFVGYALAAGDYNGDGRDDLAVGAPGEAQGAVEDAGWVVVLFGQPAGLSSAGFMSITDPSFGGIETDDQFGEALASGDFNGDGVDDLAVGAPTEVRDGVRSGAVTIFEGVAGSGPDFASAYSLTDFDTIADSNDRFGTSLTTADFNGDGNHDLAIGAPNADSPVQVDGGVVAVLLGDDPDGLAIERSQVVSGATPGAPSLPNGTRGFGRYSGAGEFDGDDYDDLVATVDSARTLVFPGTADGVGAARSHVIGKRGHAITAGDVDNDGYDDLGIGNVSANVGGDNNAGQVFFRYGVMTSTCNGQAVTVNLAHGDEPTEGPDVIVGTSGDDVIDALGGADVVCARGGDDVVRGGPGADYIDAGSGRDNVRGGGGSDEIYGAGGNDVLRGNRSADTIRGGSGADVIRGGSGSDTIVAGHGNDTVYGNGGADNIRGSKKDDTLYGGRGDDTIRGNNGRDRLFGGLGNDTCFGGRGVDTLSSC